MQKDSLNVQRIKRTFSRELRIFLEPYVNAYTTFWLCRASMLDTVFAITPPANNVILIGLIIPAIIVFAVGISRYGRFATNKKRFAALVVILAIISSGMIWGGFYLERAASSPATIEIGNHFIQIDSGETGVVNVSSSQIVDAYVAQIGTGNLTLSRQHGLYNGVDRIGVFTMGNGATAYVVSSVQQDLIIQMVSGDYMVVGNDNLTEMVSVFSQDVFNVTT